LFSAVSTLKTPSNRLPSLASDTGVESQFLERNACSIRTLASLSPVKYNVYYPAIGLGCM
jgi:hypothetical protein